MSKDGKSGVADTIIDDLTFINEGFPPIPTKVVKRIERGEYVDFGELLPKNPGSDEPSFADLAKEGIIVVTDSRHIKGQRKTIQDVATWVEAFLTFATVRNRKHPAHTNDLMAYGALIVKGARDYKGSGWLSYDYQYRRLAAARGNLGDWGKKDICLWNDVMCKPTLPETPRSSSESLVDATKGSKRKSTSQQSGSFKRPKSLSRDKQWKGSVCYQFSNTGNCTRDNCEFLHVCYDCGGHHAQSACSRKGK